MKATLYAEYIGEGYDAHLLLGRKRLDSMISGLGRAVIGPARPRKPWVAELVALSPQYGFERRFLRANWQRVRANSQHTRGVELWFVLSSDAAAYEVSAPISWRSIDRYFCRVDNVGAIHRMTREEAAKWVSAR